MKVYFLSIYLLLLICVTACETDKTLLAKGETTTDPVTTTVPNNGADSSSATDANPDSVFGSDSNAVLDADSNSDTHMNSDSDTDTGSDRDTHTNSDNDTDTDSDSHTDAGSDSDTHTNSDSHTDTDSDSHTDAGSDSDTTSDSDGTLDSESNSDTGEDTGDAPIYVPGTTCTPETAASDCGPTLECVEGVCCNETCAGACASCTIPGLEGHCLTLNKGTVCRPEATACDAAEICDGVSQECPQDKGKLLDASCGIQLSNDCNAPDTCDLDGMCQPNYATAGTPCGADLGQCKISPMCNGEGLCTSAVDKPDGTPCGNTSTTECDTPDSCIAGECIPNFASVGTPCGDTVTVSDCNLADSCDGAGACSANLVREGVPCGDTDETECNWADQCNGEGVCDPRILPDETACGDDFLSECDKPDSCLDGVCEHNNVPSGTACKENLWEVTYRCSDIDCSATPQQKVQSWSCDYGMCVEDPTDWQDVGTPCTTRQICNSDGLTFAECDPCEQEPFDECIGKVATSHEANGYCTSVAGHAECIYDAVEEDCLANTNGQTNCVDGACSEFTCEPGEKDRTYTWDIEGDAEGWTLNKWHSDQKWPWSTAAAQWFLRMDFVHSPASACYYYPPETACDSYDFNGDESQATLISPPMFLYACTTGEVSFHFTMQDEADNCPETTIIALECGVPEDWTTLWSKKDVNRYIAPSANYLTSKIDNIDITPCLGREDAVYFRFIPHNMCNMSLKYLMIDNFSITAEQEFYYPEPDDDDDDDDDIDI